jgi:hypothetical protein
MGFLGFETAEEATVVKDWLGGVWLTGDAGGGGRVKVDWARDVSGV